MLAVACPHALIGTALVAGYQPVIVLLVAVCTLGAYWPLRPDRPEVTDARHVDDCRDPRNRGPRQVTGRQECVTSNL
ncbi:hypothetical protein O7632_26995 [Solwaraspora sp. WMMD406]|uniref:hypothetical protein n=1 Tax=Solwaraspora sp. WMMD406 TaxID=3016095 RepID=UPI002415C622|nr:hypothetical protein [Solwaraspora sp. WMMD406]MDG4767713.1 hypothetical protein [Solwaraspora sp. WMMD406]